MSEYFLAVDIGASGGRHILGHLENGKMILEEIYRFKNGMISENGRLLWDLDRLFSEIVTGMKLCGDRGKIPVSAGIDTWGVDYVLLDKSGKILGGTYSYRDKRTKNIDEEVFEVIPKNHLYQRTGIQHQIFNSVFQLMAVKKQTPEIMEEAESFLMLPDYFNFLLTGNKFSEYTNATTTQLINPEAKNWDMELIRKLGFNENIFIPVSLPGTEAGTLLKNIREKTGFNCKITLTASHDTASAVMAVPITGENSLYINSGTWSLMGCELEIPDVSEKSMAANFTNEGGYEYRYRYLKNIMGLWMIQSVKKELSQNISFAELCEAAEKEKIASIVDCNGERFLSPESMTEEIKNYCAENKLQIPETASETAAVIYNSLAKCYAETALQIEDITKRKFDKINIVGGGSNADYLNKLTARYTGKTIRTGPAEATAAGNILAQMISCGYFANLKEARKCIAESFDIKIKEE